MTAKMEVKVTSFGLEEGLEVELRQVAPDEVKGLPSCEEFTSLELTSVTSSESEMYTTILRVTAAILGGNELPVSIFVPGTNYQYQGYVAQITVNAECVVLDCCPYPVN
jgi:hypothetical protein